MFQENHQPGIIHRPVQAPWKFPGYLPVVDHTNIIPKLRYPHGIARLPYFKPTKDVVLLFTNHDLPQLPPYFNSFRISQAIHIHRSKKNQASHRPSRDNALDISSPPSMNPSADGKNLGIVQGHWGLYLGAAAEIAVIRIQGVGPKKVMLVGWTIVTKTCIIYDDILQYIMCIYIYM